MGLYLFQFNQGLFMLSVINSLMLSMACMEVFVQKISSLNLDTRYCGQIHCCIPTIPKMYVTCMKVLCICYSKKVYLPNYGCGVELPSFINPIYGQMGLPSPDVIVNPIYWFGVKKAQHIYPLCVGTERSYPDNSTKVSLIVQDFFKLFYRCLKVFGKRFGWCF